MNQRTFIIILVALAAILTGWIVFATQQGAKAEPIEEITTKYWKSGHADSEAAAFNYWNEKGEVAQFCARCHSSSGFRDYIGADGSAAGSVEKPGRIQDPINCTACHSDQAHALNSAQFPNGKEIPATGKASVCMSCHSGMGSSNNVAKAIDGKAMDQVIEAQDLLSAHYYHAAAVNMGSEGGMGYQYEGKNYVGKFHHADLVDSCTKCHDPHSLHTRKVPKTGVSLCSTCHADVSGFADYKKVNMSNVDYDGNGKVESIYDELEGVKSVLLKAMHAYSLKTAGKAIAFTMDAYPYAFVDTNGDGVIDESEAKYPNDFKYFTPRLLRAAYNYMFIAKEPGAYIHNAKYALQLLIDSIEDLSAESGIGIDALTRP